MRNFVSALLALAIFLPAFLPIAPHEAVHAMYDANIMHQSGTSHKEAHHEKFHLKGQCFYIDHEHNDHHIPTDLASYYSDFLHIDLKNADQQDLLSKLNASESFDYGFIQNIVWNSPFKLKSVQKRGPPDSYVPESNSLAIYLTTQSFLI